MKLTLFILVAALLPALAARDAAAQWNVARFDADRNRVYTSFGLDPAFVSSMGVGRVVPLFDHDFHFGVDAGLAAAHMDLHDFRARLGVQTSIVNWRSVHFTGSATFLTRGTQNSIYRGFNFGSDFTGTLGVYRESWFGGGEFGFDKAIITHVTHSDWYRKYFYPDAKDGWYLNAGGTYHYGLVGGYAIGKAELVGRFGWRRTEEFDEINPPIYGSLGVGYGY
ncbi:MAG: hypothetical protein ACE15D_10980 [Candidatus Eisenbacteria bacterium]|nr:hypothetical protein [Candidatus Eisenbacteria bacterium]